MSSSKPETAIYTTDPPDVAKQKIMKAFTGGQPTAQLQRKYGGNPDACPIYKMYEMLFEDDDKKLLDRYNACKTGNLLCGECKAELAERVAKFLINHQERRGKALNYVEKYLIRHKFDVPKVRNPNRNTK